MQPDITGPLFNTEHKGHKMNSYIAYKCEFWGFNSDSTQTNLTKYYAAKNYSISAADDSIYKRIQLTSTFPISTPSG